MASFLRARVTLLSSALVPFVVACSGETVSVDAGPDVVVRDVTTPDVGGDAADASPADAAPDGPVEAGGPCTWGATGACPQGTYCDAPTCTTGTCVPLGTTESQTRMPVCGCDDVTYWNGTVAAARGMSVKDMGECKAPKTCNDMGVKCPQGTHCNAPLANQAGCVALIHPGTCWALPKMCPMIVIGPKTRACGAASCEAECDLVKKDAPYYSDNTCPQ
jgi:hypothetical protein